MSKTCPACGSPVVHRGPLAVYCSRTCYRRWYHLQHRDYLCQRQRRYRAQHLDHYRDLSRSHYLNNKDKYRAYGRKWLLNNDERRKQIALAYWRRNRDKVLAKSKFPLADQSLAIKYLQVSRQQRVINKILLEAK